MSDNNNLVEKAKRTAEYNEKRFIKYLNTDQDNIEEFVNSEYYSLKSAAAANDNDSSIWNTSKESYYDKQAMVLYGYKNAFISIAEKLLDNNHTLADDDIIYKIGLLKWYILRHHHYYVIPDTDEHIAKEAMADLNETILAIINRFKTNVPQKTRTAFVMNELDRELEPLRHFSPVTLKNYSKDMQTVIDDHKRGLSCYKGEHLYKLVGLFAIPLFVLLPFHYFFTVNDIFLRISVVVALLCITVSVCLMAFSSLLEYQDKQRREWVYERHNIIIDRYNLPFQKSYGDFLLYDHDDLMKSFNNAEWTDDGWKAKEDYVSKRLQEVHCIFDMFSDHDYYV